MTKDKKYFARYISFILALIISISLTTANYASELDEKASDYKDTVEVLIKNGVKNPNANQIEAIKKMNQYIAENSRVAQDFNDNKNIIFAFEGAGDYNNKWKKTYYHNEGRYGAMFIVVKNKEIVYITTNASTLPDNSTKNIDIHGVLKKVRTLDSQRENISNFKSGNHKSYPGLIPYNVEKGSENKAQKVKSLQGIANDGFRFNIHSGRSTEGPMSDGCLTIRDTDYIEFAKKVGYMPNSIPNNRNNFSSIQKIGTGKFVPNVVVTLVLDRTLMEKTAKSKFWKV